MIPSTLSSPKDSKPRDVFQTAGTAGSILNSEPLDGSNRGMYITVKYVDFFVVFLSLRSDEIHRNGVK